MQWRRKIVTLCGALDSTGRTVEKFTLTNNSGGELAPGWEIWYNALGSHTTTIESEPVGVEFARGTLYKMRPAQKYTPLKSGETLEMAFDSTRPTKNAMAPEGMFLVTAAGEKFPVAFTFDRLPLPNNGRREYERNLDAGEWQLEQTDINPAPKSVTGGEGTTSVSRTIRLESADEFSSEAVILADKLTSGWNAEISDAGETTVSLIADAALFPEARPEGYKIEIADGAVKIYASDPRGAFYGAQTLVDMLKGKTLPATLEDMTVVDWPDFGFRGQHIDISRNYTSKENMLRLIDLLASYKLNVLHWHFSDDEGWRLEIPGLPELTEVGARRGYTLDESDMLVPAYSGGFDPLTNTGTGYLTPAEFVEMLKYAAQRHVTIIPEIESPGHARAARIAMNVRYRKYIDTDPAKAIEFLLDDFDDISIYNSAQDYGDNVMNVALPSTYRFMEKVVDEIAAMYATAGIPLEMIHVGGDEVPHGSWTGSPIAQKFMEENGIADFTALGEYYILRVNDILKTRGIKMTGWQELVEGRSDAFRAAVKDNIGYVNCWNTNGAFAETPYHLANLGYPVVLSNVGNFYLDLAYSDHPDERGHWWGGFIDDQRAFSMQPYNIYASVRRDDRGNPVDNSSAGEGLVKLTPEGAKNILGLQGQLWAETIRNFDMTTYYLLPKMFGLTERAWNARPEWANGPEGQSAFLADYARFNAIATEREMPWLASQGYDFRLPPPGIYIENGILYANSSIPAAEIRYTTDGTDPTANSTLWTAPVETSAKQVTAKLFYLDHESVASHFE